MKNIATVREKKRIARHARIRKKVSGTHDRPRLCLHRSLNNLYAQLVDDVNGKVLSGMSTLNKDLRGRIKNGANKEAATLLGEAMAAKLVSIGFKKVSFDRGGYMYHGRVKAFVEGARKGGLEF